MMSVPQGRTPDRHQFKFFGITVKAVDDERKVITFRGTTPTPDRDGDVVVPQGADLTNFRKNPVFLWRHDWRGERLPIGKSLEERVILDVGIDFDIQFDPDDPFAMQVFNKYKNGFLNAVSIGFLPKSYERIEDRDGRFLGYRFIEWELLELSGVPIPANPDALQNALARFMKQCEAAGGLPEEMASTTHQPEAGDAGSGITLEEGVANLQGIDLEVTEIKTVTPYADLPPAPKDRAWDRAAALRRVRNWAGGEENTDWAKFRKAFCWYDPENPETVGGYKLPIADVVDGELKVVFKAVVAAMSALNGARGGVDIPDEDRRRVYSRHIRPYYAKFDEEPPELRSFAEFAASFPFELGEREGVLVIDGREVSIDLVRSLIDRDVERRKLAQTLAEIGISEDEAFRLLQAARESNGRPAPPVQRGITLSDLAEIAADAVEAKVRYLRGEVTETTKKGSAKGA